MKKPIMKYCRRCDDVCVCWHRAPNHILHAVLSLLTGGAWLIIWAALGFESLFKADRCQRCRAKV